MVRKFKKLHEDRQKDLCILCFQKYKTLRPITLKQRQLVDTHVVSGLELNDNRLPTHLCVKCRCILYMHEKGDFSKRINVFNYSSIVPPQPKNRN